MLLKKCIFAPSTKPNQMKNAILIVSTLVLIWVTGCAGSTGKNSEPADKTVITAGTKGDTPSDKAPSGGEVIHLTKSEFLNKVYNYEKNPASWVFEGDKPCIVDFYADWCRPCKMVAPILSELAQEYKGQINIYKINTDQEKELAQYFGIRSIPSILFVPVNGQPQMAQGALPKETFQKIISEVLISNSSKQ